MTPPLCCYSKNSALCVTANCHFPEVSAAGIFFWVQWGLVVTSVVCNRKPSGCCHQGFLSYLHVGSVIYRASRSGLMMATMPWFIATSPLVPWLSGASSGWLHLPGPPIFLFAKYFLSSQGGTSCWSSVTRNALHHSGLLTEPVGAGRFVFSGKNTWFRVTWGSTGVSCSSWKGLVVKPHLKNIYLFFPELFPTTITTTKMCPMQDRALFEPHLLLGCQ